MGRIDHRERNRIFESGVTRALWQVEYGLFLFSLFKWQLFVIYLFVNNDTMNTVNSHVYTRLNADHFRIYEQLLSSARVSVEKKERNVLGEGRNDRDEASRTNRRCLIKKRRKKRNRGDQRSFGFLRVSRFSLDRKTVVRKRDEGSGVTCQQESETRPADCRWTAILG